MLDTQSRTITFPNRNQEHDMFNYSMANFNKLRFPILNSELMTVIIKLDLLRVEKDLVVKIT